MTNNENELMSLGRAEIQNLIDELYDYGVDVDENGNPDILMRTVTELTRIRHILSRPQPSADVTSADNKKALDDFKWLVKCLPVNLKWRFNGAIETIRQALQSTKTPENVRCEDLKNIRDAYEGLIIYNLWRRGSDIVEGQPDPKTLGIWIETTINVMSQALQQIEGD